MRWDGLLIGRREKELASNYFIVREQDRVSPERVKLIRLFGVLNGVVYVLPTIHALASADLVSGWM